MPAAFSPLPPHNGSSQRHVPVSVIGTGRKLYGSVWVSWPGRCAEGSSPDWSRSLGSGTEVSRENPRGVLSARIILPTITASKLSLPFLSPSVLFWFSERDFKKYNFDKCMERVLRGRREMGENRMVYTTRRALIIIIITIIIIKEKDRPEPSCGVRGPVPQRPSPLTSLRVSIRISFLPPAQRFRAATADPHRPAPLRRSRCRHWASPPPAPLPLAASRWVPGSPRCPVRQGQKLRETSGGVGLLLGRSSACGFLTPLPTFPRFSPRRSSDRSLRGEEGTESPSP